MKKIIAFSSFLVFSLSACRQHHDEAPRAAASAVQAASASTVAASAIAAASAASDVSPIVAEILNSPQEQDILATSKKAMESVSASDVAQSASAASAASAPNNTSDATDTATDTNDDQRPKVNLPPACEAYYRRVDKCFAKQRDHEELQQMNEDARIDLAADKPTDQTCMALNRSFDGVARNLQCQ